MKILFVSETCGYLGGVEQHIADVCQGLVTRGHRCHLAYGRLSERDPTAYQNLFSSARAITELAPSDVPRPGANRSLKAFTEEIQPDVIYVHKVNHLPDFLVNQAVPKVVRMIHDHDLCCPRRHKYHPLTGRVCALPAGWWCALEGAFISRDPGGALRRDPIAPKLREIERNQRLSTLLVGSHYMRQTLLQNGFAPSQVRVLPPVGPWVETAPTPLPEGPEILYVGQLVRGKGVDLLLSALAQLRVPFHATVVGAGNAETGLRLQAKSLGIDAKVCFLGWVDHNRVDALYRAARVVVVPSRWPEPFGMVGLEAMRQARPVVAFDVGGIGDWLRDGATGLTVPEQDVPAFARALERLLRDSKLAQAMGDEGRRRAQGAFGFQESLDRLERALCLRDDRRSEPKRDAEAAPAMSWGGLTP